MSELRKVGRRWTLRLSDEERLTLEEGVRHHPHPQARERCAALLKVAQGHSPHWVAKHGLLFERDADSVYQWLRYYEQGGIAAWLSRRHGGPHRSRLRSERGVTRAALRASPTAARIERGSRDSQSLDFGADEAADRLFPKL